MDLGLEGKTVIITGGGSNIGRGITLAFAKEKTNITIADIDEPQAQKVANKAKELGSKAMVVKTDVTDWNQVQAMVKKTLDEYGKIDILVNNVGGDVLKLFTEKTREEYDWIIKLNYWSPIKCIRAVLDHMIERRYGRIVSIGSDAGRMGEFREAIYGGCKAATISMSKTIAREVGRYGITVNVVCPGTTPPTDPDAIGEKSLWKEAPFTAEMLEKAAKGYPLRRLGTPQDVANAVVFIASDAAGYITGQTLSVSGGYTMI